MLKSCGRSGRQSTELREFITQYGGSRESRVHRRFEAKLGRAYDGVDYGNSLAVWVGHPGLEPGANGLRIHCSTIELMTLRRHPLSTKLCGMLKPRSDEIACEVAHPEGFEPSTYGFEVRRSIQLSYGCKPRGGESSARGTPETCRGVFRGNRQSCQRVG